MCVCIDTAVYCTYERQKITDVVTVSFSLALYDERKQKYQNGSIHRKLTVTTSEREGKLSNPRGRAARAPCREKMYETLLETRARAPRFLCIDFAVAKYTVR